MNIEPENVTVHTAPCTTLHGAGANKVMESGHLPSLQATLNGQIEKGLPQNI